MEDKKCERGEWAQERAEGEGQSGCERQERIEGERDEVSEGER